jgi:hypothetical protein
MQSLTPWRNPSVRTRLRSLLAYIGVSYFLVGVMAVLTYHIARPWRWAYLAILLLIFGFPLTG